MRRTLVKIGQRQARRHPRMALKVTASAARHPRRARTLLRIAMGERRRARLRRVAVGASVVGMAAYAGHSRRAAA